MELLTQWFGKEFAFIQTLIFSQIGITYLLQMMCVIMGSLPLS